MIDEASAEANALIVSAFIDKQRELETLRAENRQLRDRMREMRASQTTPAESPA